ncbi:MAG: hypothetical protein JEZ07_06230 [Phycisphaerae bacterium]|nr:hypothetical protein [Phycisphaerae bacterium]
MFKIDMFSLCLILSNLFILALSLKLFGKKYILLSFRIMVLSGIVLMVFRRPIVIYNEGFASDFYRKSFTILLWYWFVLILGIAVEIAILLNSFKNKSKSKILSNFFIVMILILIFPLLGHTLQPANDYHLQGFADSISQRLDVDAAKVWLHNTCETNKSHQEREIPTFLRDFNVNRVSLDHLNSSNWLFAMCGSSLMQWGIIITNSNNEIIDMVKDNIDEDALVVNVSPGVWAWHNIRAK